MDEDMMMEKAPSVAVGGSGKIGIRNVDDGDETTEDFKLVRAYKVTFDSTGITDGGLMFGAGMSIRDDTGEEDMPVVKGSYVFVGGADGSWRLQFGGNDPGIDLAGGFGVADDHFGGGDDASMAFSGSFGNTEYRITAADPAITIPVRIPNIHFSENKDALAAYTDAVHKDNDWSVGVSHSMNDIKVGVGMDSEKGLAVGVGTDLGGVSTFLFWSKSERTDITVDYKGGVEGGVDWRASKEYSGLGVKASMSAGEGATFSVGYSTLKLEQKTTYKPNNSDILPEVHTGTAESKLIEVDFTYDLGGGATLTAGIDKKDVEQVRNENLVNEDKSLDGNFPLASTTTLEAAITFSF